MREKRINLNNIDIYNWIYENNCEDCDAQEECHDCYVREILEELQKKPSETAEVSSGCPYCRDKKGNVKSFFIMTDANKTIPDDDIRFCPVCGGRMR